MTENEQEQQLSVAYVHAVAARAGYACQATIVDDDSVDVKIVARGWIHERAVVRSPQLDVQLKATAQDLLRDDHLVYPLPVKNYNELRADTMVPRLLVVLQLPADPSGWLVQSEEQMISRRCAYWTSLLGQPDTENNVTVTIRLPREQQFTVDGLRTIMENASQGKLP
jgi:hypothetical protein